MLECSPPLHWLRGGVSPEPGWWPDKLVTMIALLLPLWPVVTSGDQDLSLQGHSASPAPVTIMRNEPQHNGRRGGGLMVKLLYLDYSATAVMTRGRVEILSPGHTVTWQGWPQYGYKALKFSSDNIRWFEFNSLHITFLAPMQRSFGQDILRRH